MEFTLTTEVREGYLRFFVEGQDSYQNAVAYWNELAEQCRTRRCHKALVVENCQGTLSMTDMFQLCKQLPQIIDGLTVAFVDLHEQHSDINTFGEMVATNRGCDGKVFPDEAAAERWLTGTAPKPPAFSPTRHVRSRRRKKV